MPLRSVLNHGHRTFFHGSAFPHQAGGELRPFAAPTVEGESFGPLVFAAPTRLSSMAYIFNGWIEAKLDSFSGANSLYAVILKHEHCRAHPEAPFESLKNHKGTVSTVSSCGFEAVMSAAPDPASNRILEWVNRKPVRILHVQNLTFDEAVKRGIQVFAFRDPAHRSKEEVLSPVQATGSVKKLFECAAKGELSWINGQKEYDAFPQARPALAQCFLRAFPLLEKAR